MKPIFYFLIFIIAGFASLKAQKEVIIDNQTPGWLSSQLTYSQQLEVEKIKVSGYINQTDIIFLRDLTEYSLKSIDLHDANIVKSNNYPANTLVNNFFNRQGAADKFINKLILPKSIETVRTDAFNFIYVDTLVIGYRKIGTELPHFSHTLKYVELLEGIDSICSYITYKYPGSYDGTQIISKIPESVRYIGTSTICPQYLSKGFNIPNSIEEIGGTKGSCFSGEPMGSNILIQSQKIEIPANCRTFDLGDYAISADTIVFQPKIEYIYGALCANKIIFKSKTPPNVHYICCKCDTIVCPKGCLPEYQKKFPYHEVVEEPQLIEEITFENDVIELYVGETFKLKPTYYPNDAINTTLNWNSTNQDIATVDKTGIVTAISSGEAEIVVTSTNGISSRCKVSVLQHVNGINLEPSEIRLSNLGESTNLKATVTPSDASNKNIIWESSSPNICHVTNKGLITALNYGIAIISATTEDGNFKAYCKVLIEQPKIQITSIELNYSEYTLNIKDSIQLIASITPDNATSKVLTWSSTNSEVANVDQQGLVNALNVGNCSIIATTQDGSDISAICNISVFDKNSVDELCNSVITLERTSTSLIVKGCHKGDNLYVYTFDGRLLYKTIATGADIININYQGALIVNIAGQTYKLAD